MGQSCQDNPTLPTGWEVNIGGGYKEVKGLGIRFKQRRVERGLNRSG